MDALILLLEGISPLIISFAVTGAMALLKKVIPVVDTFPALAQQLIVAVIGVLGTAVAGVLGLPLPIDLSSFEGASVFVAGLFSALAAMGIHALKKKNEVPAPDPAPEPPKR